MSEDLTVIRTFSTPALAQLALSRLQAAGLQGILLTQSSDPLAEAEGAPVAIALAVHTRDASRAEEVLAPPPAAGPG